jgi:GT2 family glycosyltransferase
MTKPLVYIVILTWNGKKDTLECLDSLKKVPYENFKVVVVDNGSADGTADEIRKNHNWIQLIVNSKNLGFTKGNSQGCDVAMRNGADYVMMLNNDVEVSPDFLDRLIEVAEADARIGAVAPLIYYYHPRKLVWSAGCTIRLLGLYNKMLFIREKDDDVPELLETQVVSGAASCIKRKVIEEVGFLDNLYFSYNEDVDLCYRIRRAGYKLITVKAAKIWHKVSAATGGAFNPVNQYLMARGRSIFIRKFGTTWEKLIFLPLAMAEASYVTTREFLRNNARAALPKYKGYFDGWRMKAIDSETLGKIKERFGRRMEK